MQAQSQFTAEQLIVAGRRAEAQGQGAYALQFYTYIADHFPNTSEAYEAREAVYRLNPPAPDQAPQTGVAHGYVASQVQHAAQPSLSVGAPMTEMRSPSLDAGAGPSHGHPSAGRKSKRRKAEAETAQSATVTDSGPSYRVGRFVAMMLSTMGWLMFIAALCMGPMMAVALTVKSLPKGLREGVANNLLAFGGATLGLLFLGLFAIFAAQVARATFDTAEAVRDLMAGQRPSGD